ncbi:MAG: response regulator [Planctomycetota bacterium]
MPDKRVFLLPGEYHVSRTPCTIATLLGSCVAVCLWHRRKHYAAMNHFLLDRCPTQDSDRGRYGNTATETIIWLMKKLDPDPTQIRASLYGGGAVVGHLGAGVNIGARNIAAARETLKANGLRGAQEEVGGATGRRIYFNTETGEVTVRRIDKSREGGDLAAKRAAIASRDTRVLIVDDSPLVRKILRQAIESTNGMEVCGEAGDAFEARDLILSADPDVISLDIIMPKMDGLKFLRKLSEHFPKPVVICSTIAKAGSDIARRAAEYGAVGVVDKDALEIYRGLEVVKNAYIPQIRQAAGKVVRKRIFDR